METPSERRKIGTERDPVEALADDYVARRRRGETPTIDEYAARCPERAEEIRAFSRRLPRWSAANHSPGRGAIRPGGTFPPRGSSAIAG